MKTRFFCYESLDMLRDAENARSHRRACNLGLSLLALNLLLLPWGIEAAKYFWQTYRPVTHHHGFLFPVILGAIIGIVSGIRKWSWRKHFVITSIALTIAALLFT